METLRQRENNPGARSQAAVKKPYEKPAITFEMPLEATADVCPVRTPTPLDPTTGKGLGSLTCNVIYS